MWSSAGGGGQKLSSQTPSAMLHLWNLPCGCSDDELGGLCQPFGMVVNISPRVGPDHNHVFIEFECDKQATSMLSHYVSSPEPAKIRGQIVGIRYWNGQEAINDGSTGEIGGNVLLVIIEGVKACDVSIDIIHKVFSPFGHVRKITTFQKAKQCIDNKHNWIEMLPAALVQFTNALAASQAMEILNGASIPRFLLPDCVEWPWLNISISANTDLNIKFQSHESRDYTNPSIPHRYYNNPCVPHDCSASDSSLQYVIGADGREEARGNVLLASIGNVDAQHAVTLDALHSVFSFCGPVQKIAIFVKNDGAEALVQYKDANTAKVAKQALEGRCIYHDGYCEIHHLSYSRRTDISIKQDNDKSRDYTRGAIQAMPQVGYAGQMYLQDGFSAPPLHPQTMHSSEYGNQRIQRMNWNRDPGNSGYPSAPVGYAGLMYPQGGFSAPPPHPHKVHFSEHGNQQHQSMNWNGNAQLGNQQHQSMKSNWNAQHGNQQNQSMNWNQNPGNSGYPQVYASSGYPPAPLGYAGYSQAGSSAPPPHPHKRTFSGANLGHGPPNKKGRF